jgi:hypothetical protein
MVTVVVVLNVLISLLCLYVAWQVWNLRRTLMVATAILTNVERSTYLVLHGAPNAISQGQLGVHGLRESYQQLDLQLQKVQQVLALIGLLQRAWRSVGRSNLRSPSRRLRRSGRYKRRQ